MSESSTKPRSSLAAARLSRPVSPAVAGEVAILMLTAERLARQGHGDLVIEATAHALRSAGYRTE